jgi:hypothetical protein
LGDDRVAVGGEDGTANAASRSQRFGNPIIHSTKIRRPAVPVPERAEYVESGGVFRSIWLGAPTFLLSCFVGVGSKPNSRIRFRPPAPPSKRTPPDCVWFAGVGRSFRSISVWFTPRERRPVHGRGEGRNFAAQSFRLLAPCFVPYLRQRSACPGFASCFCGVGINRWLNFTPCESGSPHLFLRGIGKSDDPHALSEVGRPGMDSTHHERPDGVACRFQFIVNPVIAASSEARHVLKENPTGSHFSHDPHGVKEQSGALAIDATPLRVRRAGVLAGRASANDVG